MSYQLDFCKKCVNKSFSSSEGIVCGLTDKKPTFSTTCPDFEKDVKEERKIAQRKAIQDAEAYDDAGNGGGSSWRTAFSIIIFILVIVRFAVRCSN